MYLTLLSLQRLIPGKYAGGFGVLPGQFVQVIYRAID